MKNALSAADIEYLGNLDNRQKNSSNPRVAHSSSSPLSLRRVRGEVSCAECRRLKLKCNKQVPCFSCMRRKCPHICPNGSLTTGQGPRVEPANADKLHNKLIEMSKRIRQLEDALKIAQLSISSEPHPILSDDLLAIKVGVDNPSEMEGIVHGSDVFTSPGTLTTADGGEARFVGRSGSEALMMSNDDMLYESTVRVSCPPTSLVVPEEIAHLSGTFPFAPAGVIKEDVLATILSLLPTKERATSLIEAYVVTVTWFLKPVDGEQIMEELMPMFYANPEAINDKNWREFREGQKLPEQELALLLMVFACGAVAESTLSPSNDEAELYNHLARATMCICSIFHHTSLTTVQAISMMGVMGAYDFFSCRAHKSEMYWKLQSLASCLAASIGLHRDPARWNLPERTIQRWRRLFWEIFTLDTAKSIATGRPAVFHVREVDCNFPDDTETMISEDGSVVTGFMRWKHTYAKDIIAHVSEQLCSVRPIKYSEILDLDRKIREHLPNLQKVRPSDGLGRRDVQGVLCGLLKEISLIHIHRAFFVRAMRESSGNPLRSQFAPSFLVAYGSAITLLRLMRREYERPVRPFLSHWPLWMHNFAAGIIAGTVAVRDLTPALTTTALRELELTIALFENASMHPVAHYGLPILLRLRDKVHPTTGLNSPSTDHVSYSSIDYELQLLGGATGLVQKKSNLKPGQSLDPLGDALDKVLEGKDTRVGSRTRVGFSTFPQSAFLGDSPEVIPSDSPPDLLEWLRAHQPTSQQARLSQTEAELAPVVTEGSSITINTQSCDVTAEPNMPGGSTETDASNIDDIFQLLYEEAMLPDVMSPVCATGDTVYGSLHAQGPTGAQSADGGDQASPPPLSDPFLLGTSFLLPPDSGGLMMQDFMGDTRRAGLTFSNCWDFNPGDVNEVLMDGTLGPQCDSHDTTGADTWRSEFDDPYQLGFSTEQRTEH